MTSAIQAGKPTPSVWTPSGPSHRQFNWIDFCRIWIPTSPKSAWRIPNRMPRRPRYNPGMISEPRGELEGCSGWLHPQLDDSLSTLMDPQNGSSRSQPNGPHGMSAVGRLHIIRGSAAFFPWALVPALTIERTGSQANTQEETASEDFLRLQKTDGGGHGPS